MGSSARSHLRAVNRAVKASGADSDGVDAVLVNFLRDVARQIDAKGIDGVPVGVVAAYLSASKDLARLTARNASKSTSKGAQSAQSSEVRPPAETGDGEQSAQKAPVTALEAFREKHAG